MRKPLFRPGVPDRLRGGSPQIGPGGLDPFPVTVPSKDVKTRPEAVFGSPRFGDWVRGYNWMRSLTTVPE